MIAGIGTRTSSGWLAALALAAALGLGACVPSNAPPREVRRPRPRSRPLTIS